MPNLPGSGYKGDDESQMTDQDWLDRGARVAVDLLNGERHWDCCKDEDGVGTYGAYDGDYTDNEHAIANEHTDVDTPLDIEINDPPKRGWFW